MIINHNLSAMNAQRQMGVNQTNATKSMEKLSSGLRINKAGDDAAGLAISEKMRGQIRGLDQASANAQDSISLVQTAEGALNETTSILQRMRELAVQSSNDTTTNDDRANIQKEFNQLADEINRIGNTTEFNTKKLINGDVSTNIAEGAKVVGGDLGSSVAIRSAATSGKATGVAVTGTIDIHGAKDGYAVGDKDLRTQIVSGGGLTIADGKNELTVKLGDGTEKTVTLTTGTSYTGAGAATTFLSDLNTALGAGNAVASFDSNGYLKIEDKKTGAGATSKVSVTGGNMLADITTTGTTAGFTSFSGQTANDVLKFDVIKADGSTVNKTITLKKQVYADVNALKTEINDQLDDPVTGDVDVVFTVEGNNLVATAKGTGSKSEVKNFSDSAAAYVGLTNAVSTAGEDQNNQFEIDINGTKKTVTISATPATYSDMDVYAAAVQSAINTAYSGTGESVKVTNSNGNLSITDSKTGNGSSITITDNTDTTAELIAGAKALGFTNATKINTTDSGLDGSDQALKMQIGANKGQEMAVSINDMRAEALGITSAAPSTAGITAQDGSTLDVNYASTQKVTNGSTTEYVINVSTHDGAKDAISVVDNAIAKVSSERANLGAFQNRLEHTIANLGTSSENLTSAESRIRDVNMAKEMSTFSKNNILSQAAQAMLAQANQQPQQVLQLLR